MAHPDEGLIRAFLDGELDEEDTEAFRSHSSGCPECQAEIRVQEEAVAQASGALLLLDTEPSVTEALGRFQARSDDQGEIKAGANGTDPIQARKSAPNRVPGAPRLHPCRPGFQSRN